MGRWYDEDTDEERNQSSQGSGLNVSGSDIKNTFQSMNDRFGNNNSPKGVNSANGANAAKPSNVANGAGHSAGSTAAGSAGAGAGGAAAGSGAAAGGAAATAGGTAATGAAGGAAAGSVVPGAGTLVGAAVGAAGGAVKKAAQTTAQKEAERAVEERVSKKIGEKTGKKETVADDNLGMKVAAIACGIVIGIIFLLIFLLNYLIGNVAGPVLNVYKQVCSGRNISEKFLEDCGTSTPTYEQIVACYDNQIKNAMIKAYTDTCYKEVYQIAIEQEYDLELTIESYNNTEMPYVFEGETCNVNFAEIMNLISMSPEFKTVYTEFDYQTFLDLMEEDEFRRCLYDLTVTRAEKKVFTGHLEEGESGSVSQDGVVIITHKDGSTSTITGEAAKAYYEIKIYGEVSVDHYPLKKLYDYFGVDPYAKNEIIPSMTNQQALGNLEYVSRLYYEESNWGSSQRTNLQDYRKYTGELTYDVQNVYEKDINRYSEFSDQEVYMEFPEYKQGDSKWKDMDYGSGTIGKLGCCLTSMSMVCTYYTGETITPDILNNYIYSKYDGSLIRDKIADDFGFHQYTVAERFNVEAVMGELSNGRLVIAHIRPGACGTGQYGHFVVLNGFNTQEAFFNVKEPARRLTDPVSMAQAAEVFDAYRSYGY